MLYEDFINSNIALNLKKKFRNNFFSGWGKGNNINEARHNTEKSYIKNKETNTEVIYLVSNNSETILSEINAKKKEEAPEGLLHQFFRKCPYTYCVCYIRMN